MNVFNRVLPMTVFVCGLMLTASFSLQAASFEEGKDYVTVTDITEVQQPVLREFFLIIALIVINKIH
ncbi:hypothetical protein GCM10025855_20750 [Shewanella glacialipiscicola]|uniref:Uncharacterized protein n=1 Tax=Shewanella glacialipiscicola TaxID=614069 RepID=A0ABQ6J336_9GAMM|nr:hypothetical protein GCM10025855_20750 [Shewanella glacialipiscicola]